MTLLVKDAKYTENEVQKVGYIVEFMGGAYPSIFCKNLEEVKRALEVNFENKAAIV